MGKSSIFKKLFVFFLIGFLLAACEPIEGTQSSSSITIQPSASSTPLPSAAPTPIVLNSPENLVIQCGENVQMLGTLQERYTLTLFKANGLEYYTSTNFFEGTLRGDILVSSEIKGTNMRLQSNTFTKTTVCFFGFQNGERYLGVVLPVDSLRNERSLSEQFEAVFSSRVKMPNLGWNG